VADISAHPGACEVSTEIRSRGAGVLALRAPRPRGQVSNGLDGG